MQKVSGFQWPRRLLIVGCGDVLSRALPWLSRRFRVLGTARSPESAARLRALGVVPVCADLDHPTTLRRLGGLADLVIHGAPPPASGQRDPRSRRLVAALAHRAKRPSLAQRPRLAVYLGTSGIYGDCAGAWVAETRPPQPASDRARRRLDAERTLRAWARRQRVGLALLRVPGIYAAERLPLARVERGDVCIERDDDSYSNHIHADDLARAVCAALFRGQPLRSYHINDDLPLKMGDWFDLVADAHALPRPPRVGRAEARTRLTPAMVSYLDESRRLDNRRAKRELRLRLAYPSALSLLAQHAKSTG
ncbi:NAD-dependent epimerase/dehydratase family protein [Chitiniphilus shinanonensis]|uniref:NAD-dependent epimerase/dehydratase family protein n=1 Tax=Chitiniphilus shinanonensis TaxID=553088 RepID=UPI00036D373F|nr:NAD-dependent epimerase/dehydratase family protein [Chitiniphilus shinanonensis]